MIPWWAAVITFFAGGIAALFVIALCSMNDDIEHDRKWWDDGNL